MIRIGSPIRNKSISVDTNGAINGLVSIQGLWRGNQGTKKMAKCECVANLWLVAINQGHDVRQITLCLCYMWVKWSLRIWVPSQRSPNMWRETDLNPSLTPRLFVPWHVVLSFVMLLTSCLSYHSSNEKMVNSLRASILYPSLRPYCQKKCI